MSSKTIVLVHGGGGGAGFASAADRLLAPLLGRPLVAYALDAAAGLKPALIALVSDEPGAVPDSALPAPARGARLARLASGGVRAGRGASLASTLTAAAALIGKNRAADVLVLPAGLPLVGTKTLAGLLALHRRKGCSMTLLSLGPDLEKDSVAVFRAADIAPLLAAPAGARGRASLGLLSAKLSAAGRAVGMAAGPGADESPRVAGRPDLARAAAALRDRKNDALARRGVTILDPAGTWIDWEAEIGAGTIVYPSVVIEGETVVGRDCRIYPHVHIARSRLGRRVGVLSSTVLEGCRVEDDAQLGPFTRLRPGTVIRAGAKVGNFVEMKKTVFGRGSKAQHLSYLGDSRVGEDVNIGAGTITCNYDGVNKNRTRIGAGAFIGSGTELVAPVAVGKGAYVAAGSTITKDVAADSLAIGRARQVEKPGWAAERRRQLKKARRPK